MGKDITGAFLGILEQASQEFSNHGCTEYHIPDTPSNRTLAEHLMLDTEDPDDPGLEVDESGIFVEDWLLLDYLATGIREGRITITEKD